MTEPFCGDCRRTRPTAEGAMRDCLFAHTETDLLGPLRAGAGDEVLADLWRTAMWFAAARAALGWPQRGETVAAGASVADVVARLGAQAPDAAAVLGRCAVLLDGRLVSDPAGTAVPDGARLDLLPPFAGG